MNHPRKNIRCRSALAVAVITLAAATSASAGTAAYRGVILGDSPIVYYELDETSGTTTANSGSLGAALDATIVGTVNLGEVSFGQGGTAYDFVNGLAGVAGGLPNSLAEWTVEAWVNYSKAGASNFLSNDQGGWNDDVLIGLGAENNNIPAGTVGLVHQGNPGSVRETVSQAIDSGQWYYVVMTGSESTGELRLYVDGALVDTNSALSNGATFNGADGFGSAPHLTLGHARASISELNSRRYGGLLDEVAIYASVLDAGTISTHYAAGIATAGTPPTVLVLSPEDGATEVTLSTDLVATLSQTLALTGNGTVTIRNLTLGAGSDTVIPLPDPRVTVLGSELTINPGTDLDLNTSYAVQITADALEDTDGDAFAEILNDDDWNFLTTNDATAPTIAGTSPADDLSDADPTTNLVATFDEPVALTGAGTVTIRNLTLGAGADTVISLPDSRVSVSGADLTINPDILLNFDTDYAVRISAEAVADLVENPFGGISDDSTWNFTTDSPYAGGLVGKWEFESESGGVTPDSSGNGHSGTLEGNANLTVDAERGSVLELSGLGADADRVNIDSTVEIPDLPALGGATLAAWIKRNADASAGDIYAYPIGLGTSGNFPIITIAVADATGLVTGFIEGDSGGNDQVQATGDSAVTNGEWTHIAITYDRINNEAITYVNGVAQGTPTDISIVGDGPLDWGSGIIGRNVNGASNDVNHLGGLVDDVCYYDKVLAPGEVETLYTSTLGAPTFASWISGFSVGGLTGFDDDFDGDGQGNGLENFLGTDPSVFSPGLSAGTLVGGNTFGFSHPQNAEPAGDITAPAYRWSKDLVTWNDDGDTDGDGTKVDFTPLVDDPVSGTTTVTATVTGTATDKLFMQLSVSQILPPPPLLSENFDAAASLPADWTSSVPSNGTEWGFGVPSGVTSGPTAANSDPNCAGTNIGGYYTENADVSLISPSFLVPVGSGASLSFRQFIDTDLAGAPSDLGSVRILDADNADTPIAGLEITGIEGDGTGGWTNGATLPMTAGDVGGKNIKVEFRFVSNAGTVQDTDVWSGFYVDDVVVTEVAP